MAPTVDRDLTEAERLELRLGTGALAAAVALACVAGAASTFALYWLFRHPLGWPAPIAAVFPLAVDGVAIVAAIVTVLRDGRLRAFAWMVFGLLLALSLAGNVAHAYATGDPSMLPRWLFAAMAAAPPVIVGLSVHLYALIARHGITTRMRAGVRDRVLVDVDAFTTGKTRTAPRRPATPTPEPAPESAPEPARSVTGPQSPWPPRPPSDGPVLWVGGPDPRNPHYHEGHTPPAEPEDAAKAAYFQLVADGTLPTGADVAELLVAHGARGRRVSDAQGRKVRDRWRAEAPTEPAEPEFATVVYQQPADRDRAS